MKNYNKYCLPCRLYVKYLVVSYLHRHDEGVRFYWVSHVKERLTKSLNTSADVV